MKTTLFSVFLLLAAAAYLPAQEGVITEKEFYDVDSTARKFLKELSYRSIVRDGTSENPGQTQRTTIYESVPPDRTRTLVTEKTNGVTKTTETINIGPKIFIRKDGGKWEIPGPRDPNRYTIVGDRDDQERVNEYKLSTGAMLGDEKADLYEASEITTYKSAAGSRRTWTRRLWIDKKGMMVKYENVFTDAGGTSSYTIVYEYDPKIKIEAPITATKN